MAIDQIPLSFIELLFTAVLMLGGIIAVVFSAHSSRALLWPLLVALAARMLAAVAHRILFIIPQGRADAVSMERRAWEWAQSGCGNMGEHLNLSGSYVHSWLVGNVYACTDRGPLVFQTINVLLGVLTVLFIARLAERLWDRQAGIRAAWVAALFPMLIIYSAVPLREVWFTALVMLGALWLVEWVQRGSTIKLGGVAAAFFGASIFHGGAFFALVVMAVIIMSWAMREILRGLNTGRARASLLVGALILGGAGGVGVVVMDELRFSSIGDVMRIMEQLDTLDERTASAARDGAAYPSYLIPSGGLDNLLLTLPRMMYLLVAPLPWDVRGPTHLVGWLDGLFYLAFIVLLWRFRARWWHRRDFRMIVFVLLALTLVYGWGTSNFGTGLRHRAKFVGLFIALGAGLLGCKVWREARLEFLDKVKSSWITSKSSRSKPSRPIKPLRY